METKYQILKSTQGIEDLEKKVNEYIHYGWVPIGGVCFVLPDDIREHGDSGPPSIHHDRYRHRGIWTQAVIHKDLVHAR
ncbi:MAG: hypothetical protein CMK59_06320 [Proteobacteria bacterium]|nr:hypothetical protein [Pseudomonadota bacterium]|tara:strand:+ start:455 stop:691 length:237 start_codon:yes stop_codon:yes gene_type:complete